MIRRNRATTEVAPTCMQLLPKSRTYCQQLPYSLDILHELTKRKSFI
uniref:Uncharacterized protein n=1 Tax=Meloidogyne enterolobii TaxID=390850 RepID=A0A6V7WW47_MELEN|nr:unnamed protein product [Meloidogyne enterolobii]